MRQNKSNFSSKDIKPVQKSQDQTPFFSGQNSAMSKRSPMTFNLATQRGELMKEGDIFFKKMSQSVSGHFRKINRPTVDAVFSNSRSNPRRFGNFLSRHIFYFNRSKKTIAPKIIRQLKKGKRVAERILHPFRIITQFIRAQFCQQLRRAMRVKRGNWRADLSFVRKNWLDSYSRLIWETKRLQARCGDFSFKIFFRRIKNIYLEKEFRKLLDQIKKIRKQKSSDHHPQRPRIFPRLSLGGLVSKRSGAIAVLLIFLVTSFFQNTRQTQGATYLFVQTDWSGGATANTAVHPTNATGWTQYSSGTNVVTNVSGQATLAETAHQNFTETFTTTTYKDAANTTANWNTTAGQVEMASEMAGINLKSKINGYLEGGQIYSHLKTGNEIYFGAAVGKFIKYNTATDTTTDLTAKISSFWTTNDLYSLVLDSANGVIYIGGSGGLFAKYTIGTDTATDLTSKISGFWGSSALYSLAFDSSNSVVYLGGGSAKFAKYTVGTDTATDLSSKISSFWFGENINRLEYDSANGSIFISSESNGRFARYVIASDTAENLQGKLVSVYGTNEAVQSLIYHNGDVFGASNNGSFYKYNIAGGTLTDLTSKIYSFWGLGYYIQTSVADTANGVIYFAGQSGKFAKYTIGTDTATDLTSKISSFWSSSYIRSLTLDTVNGVVYLGGQSGKFAKYTIGTDTATNLTSKISAFWSTSAVQSLTFDSANSVIYLGGGSGKFAQYTIGTDTATDLTAKISAFWSTNSVFALSLDGANGVVYLGGDGGKFAKYTIGTDTATDLTAKISAFWSTNTIYALTFDSTNGVIYLDGVGVRFAKYTIGTDTATDLTAKISAFWSTSQAFSLTLDTVNGVVYLGGQNGKFAKYTIGTDTATDLTSVALGSGVFTGGYSLSRMKLDSGNGVLYLGGDTGKFGKYTLGTTTATDLTSKISAFWSTETVRSLAIDTANSVVYLGGNNGKFAKYTIGTDTAADLTAKISAFWPTTSTIFSLIFDSGSGQIYLGGYARFAQYTIGTDTAADLTTKVNGINWDLFAVYGIVNGAGDDVYLVGPSMRFGKYNTQTGIVTDLSSKISSFWSSSAINEAVYDSVNGVIYIAGTSGRFAKYTIGTDTATNLTSKISAFWSTNEIHNLRIDQGSGAVYLGGANGKFAKYTIGTDTATDLTARISAFWSTNVVYALTFDSANGAVYLGGQGGKFAKYTIGTDTATDLTSKISAFWSTNVVYALSLDSTNGVVYLGGQNGKFAKYTIGTDTATDLTSKISAFWSTSQVNELTNLSSGAIYLGGNGGKFAKYIVQSDSALNLRSPDLLSFWSTSNINALGFGNNGKLYVGGASGSFSEKPMVPATTSAHSLAVDSVSYDIYYATLTKNDTPGTGTVSYELSNNGGANWESVTPGVQHDFSTTGSDLRFKITVSGNATVQDVTVAYWSLNTSGSLISSKYDASDSTNTLARIAWTESLAANTDIRFQVRTSADGSNWSAWCGPDDGVPGSCNSGTYFTNPAGAETIDDLNSDQTNDQWIQYQAYLISNGKFSPTLSDVTTTYVVNAPPEIQNLSASQGTNGLVTVNYEIRDPDTTTGATPGSVVITLQYCTANCSNPGSETWNNAAAVSGDVGAGVSVQEVNWTSHQIIWTPKTDYGNQYNDTNFKIRIRAYDGELANHTAYAQSGVFTLDTTDPGLQNDTLLINDSSAPVDQYLPGLTLKLQNISGDVPAEHLYAQFSGDGATWYGANGNGTLAAAGNWGTGFDLNDLGSLSWAWTMASRSETLTVRIKDGYGNLQATTDTNSARYNSYPEVQSVSASQGSNNLVTVNYQVRDSDTLTGGNPGEVSVTLEYCTSNCSVPGGETWTAAAAVTGDAGAGVSVEGVNWTSHQVVWTAKTDYPDEFNDADFKVRVKVDDGETIFNLDYAESGQFILDTADPQNVSVRINHPDNELIMTLPTDDSSFQMALSNIPGNFPVFEDFSSPYTYNDLTDDPATIYLRIRDAFGNYTDAQGQTPAEPQQIAYYDISVPINNEYRELITWTTVPPGEVGAGFGYYNIWRSEDGINFVLVNQEANRERNYIIDENLDPLVTYTYRVNSEDINGNLSNYSGTISDQPNGTGSSDSTPPTVDNVEVTDIGTTQATVNWTTDEVSDSVVGYSEDFSYLPERGVASLVQNHSLVITGLIPDTTYNIRVKSRDFMGNLGQVDYNSPGNNIPTDFVFTTNPGPAISNVTVQHISNERATIYWLTTTDSNSYVVYSDAVESGQLVDPIEIGTPDLVNGGPPVEHSQEISGLTEGTMYYFYVKSTDASDNTAIDNNGGNFYAITTTVDNDPPAISAIDAAVVSDTEAAVGWVTDEAADSKVEYSTTSGSYTSESSVLLLDRSHFVVLSGLASDTQYYYRVVSRDINGNEAVSAENSFITLPDPVYQHPPLTAISNISDPPAVLTDTKAVITFDTDQAAECAIEFGTQSGNYTEVPVSESGYNESHALHVPGLIFETTYYYQIICADNLANTVNSSEYSFTTLERQYGQTEAEGLGDAVAPAISNLSSKVVSGESVTVAWETDEPGSSFVRFGYESTTYSDMAGDALVNDDKTNYALDHAVTINGLVPGIKYYFTVLSHDAAGNIAESSEASFTTKASSSLSSINIASTEMGEALITWKTSAKTSSVVEYGTSNLYGEKKESTTKTSDHSVTINGLNPATVYHLRVKGEDENGQLYSSGDYTFTPKSPPQVGLVIVQEVTEHSAKVSFATDLPTSYSVTYTSLTDPEDSGSKGKPDLAINHEIVLDKLKPGTTYALKVKVLDGDGNSVEADAPSFTTGRDEKAPQVTKSRTESALAQNDKVQTILSWETDELASCRLLYREGAGGEEREYNLDERPTLSHVAVVTSFKPGTVYYFRIKSVDEAGNESLSSEYALLTPQKKENIVQIIVNNFQEIFSWVDRI